MGIFRKTLKDVKEAVLKEELRRADLILRDHLSKDNEFMTDLAALQVSISKHKEGIEEMRNWLKNRWKARREGRKMDERNIQRHTFKASLDKA